MEIWKNCGTCKKPIFYGGRYYLCSVSSCQKKSNTLIFCSVTCWDVHVPIMRHQSAWAEENFAPHRPSERRIVDSPSHGVNHTVNSHKSDEEDILIVASKLKAFVKARGDLNTSADVMEKLSDIVRELCLKAMERAKSDGRKTLMEKDF